MREFTEQELVRREKAENIRNLGMDPFGQKFERTDFAQDIKDKYSPVEHDAFENMEDKSKKVISYIVFAVGAPVIILSGWVIEAFEDMGIVFEDEDLWE